jgi:hypothetical protein
MPSAIGRWAGLTAQPGPAAGSQDSRPLKLPSARSAGGGLPCLLRRSDAINPRSASSPGRRRAAATRRRLRTQRSRPRSASAQSRAARCHSRPAFVFPSPGLSAVGAMSVRRRRRIARSPRRQPPPPGEIGAAHAALLAIVVAWIQAARSKAVWSFRATWPTTRLLVRVAEGCARGSSRRSREHLLAECGARGNLRRTWRLARPEAGQFQRDAHETSS